MEKTYEKLPELLKAIGRKGKVIDTPVAGCTGKIGTIIEAHGDDIQGYRFTLEFVPPIGPMGKIEKLSPPCFMVEII